MTQTYFPYLFPFYFSSVTWRKLTQCIHLPVDSFSLTPFSLTHSPWLLSHWLILVDLLHDSYWLILVLIDSYFLTCLTHSDSLLVQVLVVVADLCLYKNPLKPTHSSLPLSSSFTSKYNVSCLVHCLLVWIPSILTLAFVYLSVGDHLEVLQVVL